MNSAKLKANNVNDKIMSDLEVVAAGLMNNFNLLQQYPDLKVVPCIDKIRLSYENQYYAALKNGIVQEFGSYKPVKTKGVMVLQFYEQGEHIITIEPQRNNWGRLLPCTSQP